MFVEVVVCEYECLHMQLKLMDWFKSGCSFLISTTNRNMLFLRLSHTGNSTVMANKKNKNKTASQNRLLVKSMDNRRGDVIVDEVIPWLITNQPSSSKRE